MGRVRAANASSVHSCHYSLKQNNRAVSSLSGLDGEKELRLPLPSGG